MLSVTCDNVSANDVMVRTLAKIIVHFPGAANRVRCQAHIVNLVVQIILRQFDAPKKKGKGKKGKGHFDGEDIEEEDDGEGEGGDGEDSDGEDDDDGDDGVVQDDNGNNGDDDGVEDAVEDVEAAMAEELKKAAEHVKPVQNVLSKVIDSITLTSLLPPLTHAVYTAHPCCPHYYHPRLTLLPPTSSMAPPSNIQLQKLANSIKNSSTKSLPRWKEIIKEVIASSPEDSPNRKLTVRMMPRDVRTRWNSTFDMVKFALSYRDAIDKITSERSLKLRKYELGENEWELVKQVRDCLRVCDRWLWSVRFTDIEC